MTDYQTYLLLQFLCWYPRPKFGLWYSNSHKLGVIRYLCMNGSRQCPGMEAESPWRSGSTACEYIATLSIKRL
jgi:hypothetical protein